MEALDTPRLRLEPLVPAHADALYPIVADLRVLEFIDQDAPASVEALRDRFRRLAVRRSPDGRQHWLNWALHPRPGASADAIGFVQATVLDDGRAWVAYVVAPALWGRGLAGEAVGAMLDHLAVRYGATRFLATADARNVRSGRLLERLGFARAGAAERLRHEVAEHDVLYVRG